MDLPIVKAQKPQVVEAQLEHRYRALGGTAQYPGAGGR
jgi:hypothetical protein